MFRKYVLEINKAPKLQIIVCDEGHRLKNVDGTKTIAALKQCVAPKRLVLTGTPLQNNLDELYSIVSFIRPDMLGPLSRFKQMISVPIEQGRQVNASLLDRRMTMRAFNILHDIMKKVMIRRTQEEVLRRILPPRFDETIYTELTPAQKQAYFAQEMDIIRYIAMLF